MISTLAALVLLAGPQPLAEPPPKEPDPIAARVFPPDAIMRAQEQLGIDDAQRKAIIKEIQATQTEMVSLQWEMQAAREQLATLLDGPRVDEARALAQADKVMALESKVKHTQLTLVIRLKNLLTPAQQEKLRQLR